jgi:dipeptidase D
MIMGRALQNIEPELVWSIFEDLCQVPRPSKKEEKIIKYMKDWAAQHNFAVKEDATGNFVIKKPATPGMENRKTICIQGHVDMVCEKNADVEFDFDNDPIQCYVDGDWVKARGTTLGADNGLGVAMGMAILQSTDIAHPNIELLCTLDEETGLTGAMGLSKDLLEAEILINLDSEEDGAFTIGCAGGLNTFGHYKYESTEVPENYVAYKVAVRGLRGGHSGIEIHTGRANAAKFLNRLLWNLTNKFDILLSDFNSGNKHNAIPREGFATVLVPKTKEADFLAYVELFHKQSVAEYSSVEPNLRINAETTGAPTKAMAKDFQKRLLHSFYAMPHGVYRMSPEIKGLVQTSTNFAIIETREDEVYVLTSQRSSVESEKIDMANVVKCSMELGGATTEFSDGYPAWEPNMKSSILNRGVEIYKALFGKDPHIEAIHAGLECGLVGEKYPAMDMISFGPDLRDVHSPDEMASIPSTEKTWKFLVELVKNTPVK